VVVECSGCRVGSVRAAHCNSFLQEAYRIGLVNEVVTAANLIPRVEAILKQIFSNARSS
jgi:enoyl-CoA hydratase/carnithine racemase